MTLFKISEDELDYNHPMALLLFLEQSGGGSYTVNSDGSLEITPADGQPVIVNISFDDKGRYVVNMSEAGRVGM